jgi:uncharacterized repeat protein (TIGR01451 family)
VSRRRNLVATVLALGVWGALAGPAAAATWVVNTTTDTNPSVSGCPGPSGVCSLRQAVSKASVGEGTVEVPANATPYSVTLGAIPITASLAIAGAGARTTRIQGNESSEIFEIKATIDSIVGISGLAISHGMSTEGGALYDESPLSTVNLNAVALTENTAKSGGAIELISGAMRVTGSTIGPGNAAVAGNGGAVDNHDGTLTIEDSTIEGNSATGGKGGGISTATSEGKTALHYATVAFNNATGTGAEGGNLYSNNPNNDPAGFTASETIVADGSAPSGGDCNSNSGGFISEGFNLTDGVAATATASCNFTQPTDRLSDTRLGGLTDNAGQTDTSALAAGSPAIDAIPTANAACTGDDQRAIARPQGAGCDIGALEAGGGETAPQWNAAHDFRTSPQENPSPDSNGNSGVWSYEEAPIADLHVPGDYTLMPTKALEAGCPSLYYWSREGNLPVVDFNAGAVTDTCSGSVTIPAHTIVMHPSPGAYSILAWTAPASGSFDVAGSFTSMDLNGGLGTTWYLDRGSTNLAEGVNPRGGAGVFEPPALSLKAGETLYLILGPAEGGEDTFDTTALALTIAQPASESQSADLRLAAEAQPNPIAVGETVTDTFTVTNAGPDEAQAVSFSDPLPGSVTLKSATASQGTCEGTVEVKCSLGSLTAKGQASVKVVLEPTKSAVLLNTAKVSSATQDPEGANNSATAESTVTAPACPTSMTVEAVQVLADRICEQGNGTYLASGNTRFSGGASIVLAGTQTAPLIIDPAAHSISIAPAEGGGEQSGELEVNGVDVASGKLLLDTQSVQDPVSGVSGSALVTGVTNVALALSGWSFSEVGVTPTAYLLPSGAGGGALVDGQLTLPTWLGSVIEFGPLGGSFSSSLSGQLAVQVDSTGQVGVRNGGISFQASVLGLPQIKLVQASLNYQRAGDIWNGSAVLGMASLVGLTVNTTIGQGKLEDLEASFSCSQSKVCGTNKVPTIGAIFDVKDVALKMLNLQGISYTPFSFSPFNLPRPCVPVFRFKVSCPAQPPPPPAPQLDGAVIVGLLGDKVIAGGNFTYLLDGAFSAEGSVELAPLHGGTFPDPEALKKNKSAQEVVNEIQKTVGTGVELAGAQVSFTPPHLLQASGKLFLPPPPFPVQFLEGKISLGIDPPHFTGEGSLTLVVPGYVPIIGGDRFGGVQALVSDRAAAGEVEVPGWCVKYIGCTPSLSALVAFEYQNASFHVKIDEGSIGEYGTVAQVRAGSARSQASRRTIRIPAGKQMASVTVTSARGTPNVRLLGPPGAHRRVIALASSRKPRNRTGALAWTDKTGHSESFLVFLPKGGRWTVTRISGPAIAAVKVTVPRHKMHAVSVPRARPRGRDLPKGTVSTSGSITLHYSVPHAAPGTTVELWAGTGPHGAGGVMIAEGLPPSGAANWKLAGLASGRYWPYAIVEQNGIPVSIDYWSSPVTVANPSAPAAPTGVQAVAEGTQMLIAWNQVPAASTYAVTATPPGGRAVVRDAVPASQLGDRLTLAPGAWSITVQGVDSEDVAGPASAPQSVTVP